MQDVQEVEVQEADRLAGQSAGPLAPGEWKQIAADTEGA